MIFGAAATSTTLSPVVVQPLTDSNKAGVKPGRPLRRKGTAPASIATVQERTTITPPSATLRVTGRRGRKTHQRTKETAARIKPGKAKQDQRKRSPGWKKRSRSGARITPATISRIRAV